MFFGYMGNAATDSNAALSIKALGDLRSLKTLNLFENDLEFLREQEKTFYDALAETAKKTGLQTIFGLKFRRADFPQKKITQKQNYQPLRSHAPSFLMIMRGLLKTAPFNIALHRQLKPTPNDPLSKCFLNKIVDYLGEKERAAFDIVFYKKLNPQLFDKLPTELLYPIREFLGGNSLTPPQSSNQFIPEPFGSEKYGSNRYTTKQLRQQIVLATREKSSCAIM
jgi:hypothetical protein